MNCKYLIAAALAAASLGTSHLAYAADTPGSNPSVKAPSVSERLAAARKAIDAKDWSLAMRELNAAERDDARNADVQNLLGYSYRKRANPDLPKAFDHYKKALAIDPRHKGAHEYIGEAYLMDKKPAEAEKHLAQLEQICGNKTCEEYQDLAKSIAEYKAKN
ncbi:lipopolysaccharide assembly protein LapB [Caenimonas koreensis]|uniref:Tetratricopeptide repeat-containing protein n=1 Tax=Caenimonas koreensis DSM 17982 TaxID=1121255 RepID=A0A844AWB5_9BURK|nr:tetratricopeptide repeat protein [Caenimonas koreensis]MRD46668.1 hypothetical protein [Caenimonas koreensis DSM 17982]